MAGTAASPRAAGAAAALLWLLLLTACTPARACEHSGYCSLGQVRPWSGCIDSHAALLDALAARGHRREVVLSVFMSNWVEMIGQQWASMRRLGMGHLLTLALPGRDACQALLGVLPEVGCAWSEAIADYWAEIPLYQMWVLRHMVASRMARAGWNVLVLDGDVLFVTDPYRYLKRPPFSDHQLIVHQEGGWGLNCGSYYVQNTGPAGPALYFLAELVDRALRHRDDDYRWLEARGYVWQCVTWEQGQFNDVMFSMLLGAPLLGWTAVRDCRTQQVAGTERAKREAALVEEALMQGLARAGVRDLDRGSWFDMGGQPWWREMYAWRGGQQGAAPAGVEAAAAEPGQQGSEVGGSFWTKVAPIRIPRHRWSAGNATLDAEMPGWQSGPPLPRGKWASMWRRMLEGASDAPLWPDPEDPQAEATSTPQQLQALDVVHKLMWAPHFLMSPWALGGHLGLWTNHTQLTLTWPPQDATPASSSAAGDCATAAAPAAEAVPSAALHAPSADPATAAAPTAEAVPSAALQAATALVDAYLSGGRKPLSSSSSSSASALASAFASPSTALPGPHRLQRRPWRRLRQQQHEPHALAVPHAHVHTEPDEDADGGGDDDDPMAAATADLLHTSRLHAHGDGEEEEGEYDELVTSSSSAATTTSTTTVSSTAAATSTLTRRRRRRRRQRSGGGSQAAWASSDAEGRVAPSAAPGGGRGRRARAPVLPSLPEFHSVGSHRDVSLRAAQALRRTGHLPLPPRLAAPSLTAASPNGAQDTTAAQQQQQQRAGGAPHLSLVHRAVAEEGREVLMRHAELRVWLVPAPGEGQQEEKEGTRGGGDTGSREGGGARALLGRNDGGAAAAVQQGNPRQPQEGEAAAPRGGVVVRHEVAHQVTAALAHITAVPFSPHVTKLVLLRYLGLFDWDVHERIRTNASRAATTSNATAASPPPSISQQADQQQAQQGSAAAVPTTDLSIQQQQQEQPGGRREFIDDATALPATAPTSLPGAQHQQRLPTDQDDLTHDDYAHIRRRRSLFSRSRQPAHDRPAGAPQRRRSSFAALPLPHASYAHRSRRRALQQEQPLRNDAATVAPACAAPPAPGLYYGSLPCRPVPLLVAYHPAVPLHLAHNRTAFQVLLRGLAQVAALLNRTVLWPDVPCAARWVTKGEPQLLHQVPYGGLLDTHAQPYGRLGMQRCFNQRYTDVACLQHGRGMVEAEFSHLLSKAPADRRALYRAAPSNTILRLEPAAPSTDAGGAGEARWRSFLDPRAQLSWTPRTDLMDSVLRVSAYEVAGEARRAAEGSAAASPEEQEPAPVLYLAHPVEVDWALNDAGDSGAGGQGDPEDGRRQARQAYEAFQASCPALGAGMDGLGGPHSLGPFARGRVVAPR